MCKHSLIDLTVKAVGDIEVDAHHTVEDTGIVLGDCIREALGDKKGIRRYGMSYLPMDENTEPLRGSISATAPTSNSAPLHPPPMRPISPSP